MKENDRNGMKRRKKLRDGRERKKGEKFLNEEKNKKKREEGT